MIPHMGTSCVHTEPTSHQKWTHSTQILDAILHFVDSYLKVIYVLFVNLQPLVSEVEGRRSATAQVDRACSLWLWSPLLPMFLCSSFPLTVHTKQKSQRTYYNYVLNQSSETVLRFGGPRAGITVGIWELLLCVLLSVCSYVVALWGFRLRAVMGSASPLQCLSLTSSGAQFVELSCSRRSRTLSPNVSSSSSTCFGASTRLRCGGFELPSVSSRSHRRPTVAASTGPFKVR